MTINEQIALLQGVKEGRTLQYSNDGKLWRDHGILGGVFFLPLTYYRLKPEPRRFWIVKRLDGARVVFDSLPTIYPEETAIPVVEVLP